MNNMELWDKLKSPPDSAKKKITGGRLKGMTDIKPQWRMLIMTENFGPVGIGWKYTIEKLWTERTDDAHVCAFALVNFFIKHDGGWSEPIPGIGGSMLLVQETAKRYTSDEAYKMAVTDALSVAMKALGVGADVYMGYSDSKNPTRPPTSPPASSGGGYVCISEAQGKRLVAICLTAKIKTSEVATKFGFKKVGDIKKSKYKEICEWAEVGHKEEMVQEVFDESQPNPDDQPF